MSLSFHNLLSETKDQCQNGKDCHWHESESLFSTKLAHLSEPGHQLKEFLITTKPDGLGHKALSKIGINIDPKIQSPSTLERRGNQIIQTLPDDEKPCGRNLLAARADTFVDWSLDMSIKSRKQGKIGQANNLGQRSVDFEHLRDQTKTG
jgi:hypothetical protein